MERMREEQFVKIAKALADPTRHRILRTIRERGELNCSQIWDCFRLSQPTISHHIKTLAEAGLVTCRREGTFHVVKADESVLEAFARSVAPSPARAPRARRRGRASAGG